MTAAVAVESKKRMMGGDFLIEASASASVFTLEDLSEEQRQIAKMTSSFAEERIRPQTDSIEKKDFNAIRALLREAGDLGLLGVDVPEEYGGVEMDKITSALIADRISVSGSFSVVFGGQVGIGLLPLVWYGTARQKERYLEKLVAGEWVAAYALSESSSGSDAMNIRTRATLSGDGEHYVIDGEKMWITNAAFADLFTVFAKIDGDKFSAFLIERGTPGLTIGAEEHKLGLRGSSTCSLILNDCKVPVENQLGQVGKGHHIAFNILNVGRYKLAATGLGASRVALRDGIRYGRERISFGKPITSFGLIQEMIARSSAEVYALESTLYRVVGAIDEALRELDKASRGYTQEVQKRIEEFAVECSILKVFGSEVLGAVVDRMLQVYGGYGYVEEYPAERSFRDARIHRIFEGTNEVNRLIIVNWTMKRAMQGSLALHPSIEQAMAEADLSGECGFDGPLAGEQRLVQQARRIGLCCLGLASRRFGKDLAEQQEIMGALADIFIQLLAMESCVLRAEKTHYACTAVSLTRYFVASAFGLVRDAAERIIGDSAEGDLLSDWTRKLASLTAHEPANRVSLGRELSTLMVAAGQYTL